MDGISLRWRWRWGDRGGAGVLVSAFLFVACETTVDARKLDAGADGQGLDAGGAQADDLCPTDPNKTEPGKCGCEVPETTACEGRCAPACSAPTPICGPDLKCTDTRWVEPISTLPEKWRSTLDTSVWTKWVRSVLPIVGQDATQDAALLEVAYYAERIHMPHGQVVVPDLIHSMLGDHPTRFSVYPACPGAYMHPAVKPTMSSGGGAPDETLVSEDWILRYPKCTEALAVACNLIPAGTLCNNCQWQNPLEPESCRDTLAHEHGHTSDLHRRVWLDFSIDAVARQVFPDYPTEGPAWAASAYFMNPSLETSLGRDHQPTMPKRELNYWSITHKFTMSAYPPGWGYVLKTTRCPEAGLTEPCPDTLTRTYVVPLDNYGARH
jgi:hypothetical protein